MFVKEYFSKCIVLSFFLNLGISKCFEHSASVVVKPLEFIKISFTRYLSSISVTIETIRIFWKFYYPEACDTCSHSFIPIVTISEVALSRALLPGLHSDFFSRVATFALYSNIHYSSYLIHSSQF